MRDGYLIIIDGSVAATRCTLRDATHCLNSYLSRMPESDVILARVITEYGGVFNGKE